MKNALFALIIVGALLGFSMQAQADVYTNEAAFDAALSGLGLSATADNFSAYALGNISNGQTLGAFTYTYDSTATQPGVAVNGTSPAPSGSSGQALGDTYLGTDPNVQGGVFVGGEAVTLTNTGGLAALGAEFSYAPDFEPVPGDTYQLAILDGSSPITVGNPDGLDANGGSFFLGYIGNSFTQVSLQSSSTASDGSLVPAYQVDYIDYAGAGPTTVPEPCSFLLVVGSGLGLLIPLRRRRAQPGTNS